MNLLRTSLLSVFTLLSLHSIGQNTPCREIVGYYPGWQWYDRNQLVRPATIDYFKYTILQYAFLNMDANGNLNVFDPWGDKNLLLGQINWSVAPAGYDSAYDLGNPDYHVPGTSLADYAHDNNVKLLVSLGGWTLSSLFPGIAADETKRGNFAAQCALICELYDLDGVDIDWEYPGYAPHNGTPADAANYTLLLQDIRNALDEMEVEMNRELLLTAAVGAAASHQSNYEWNNIVPLLDIINVMTYDFYGSFDPLLNHNAPLYASAQGDPEFNCASSVERLINEYGVPADKITMGLPFYGRTQLSNSTPQLFGQGNGQVDLQNFGQDEGTPLYYNILLADGYTNYWDEQASVPYAINPTNNSFLSYDDVQSITAKSQYIADMNLRGAIIWEITGDYIETSPGSGVIASTPLVNAVNEVFCATPQAVAEHPETSPVIWPNPVASSLHVAVSAGLMPEVVTLDGRSLELPVHRNNDYCIIDVRELAAGMYLLKTGAHTLRFVRE
jgi:chitinase